jgi:hypothetical protein
MILVLALVTVTFSPPAPTVGDPITITFQQPVRLDPSPSYEIVSGAAPASGAGLSRFGGRGRPPLHYSVVIRTFIPRPILLSGVAGNVRFQNLKIPVRSVLKQGDDMKPAPLTPPRASPYPRAPFIAIAIAALVAIAAWLAAWLLSRRVVRIVEPPIPASERYRRAVVALREDPSRAHRWAALADATRAYLAESRANLSSDLTTTELVPRLPEHERVVAEILRQGDAEKFSREGAPQRDFNEVAERALELAS